MAKAVDSAIALIGLSFACISETDLDRNEVHTDMFRFWCTFESHALYGNPSSRAKDQISREVVVMPLIAHDTTSMSVTIATAVVAASDCVAWLKMARYG